MKNGSHISINESLTGAILCGGENSRMGSPKASALLWDNRPILIHLLETLSPLCQEIILVGDTHGFSQETLKSLLPDDLADKLSQLPDLNQGLGPISGLEALLTSGLDSQYLVLTCDQPLVQTQTLHHLVESMTQAGQDLAFFTSPDNEKLHPFPGVFPERLLPKIQQAITTHNYSIRDLIATEAAFWHRINKSEMDSLININTPEILAAVNQTKINPSEASKNPDALHA